MSYFPIILHLHSSVLSIYLSYAWRSCDAQFDPSTRGSDLAQGGYGCVCQFLRDIPILYMLWSERFGH